MLEFRIPDLERVGAAAGVPIADLSLRRPTLDDVFLALTGRTAEGEDEGAEAPPAGRRGRGRRARDREAATARP